MDKNLQADNPDGYSDEDFERSRNRMFVDKTTKVIEDNPYTHTESFDETDSVLNEISSIVLPTEEDQTLVRLGYSRVEIGKIIELSKDGAIVYPVATTVTTYDIEGNERESFSLTEKSELEIEPGILDNENTHLMGFDVDDGLPVFDNPTLFDHEMPDGTIPSKNKMTPQQELTLLSVLNVCESTLATTTV